MVTLYYIVLILSTALFGSLLTLGAYWLMGRLAMLDDPNERSNHHSTTITGVGIGFIIAICAFLVVVNASSQIILATLGLMLVSAYDDRHHLSVLKRLGFQLMAIIFALHTFNGTVFLGLLPVWLDMAVTAILWLWMINLTNFMDGIDEITVTETGSITAGIIVLGMVLESLPHAIMVDALVVLVGVLTFYPWNKHPARCFMGDAGSVPLGYLLGYLLLSLSAAGLWYIALILPAYHITDATFTLLRRVVRGEKFWQPHSQHFYQQAVRAGRPHDQVSHHILVLNVLLVLLAGAASYRPDIAIMLVGAAYAFSLMLCFYFAKPPKQVMHETTA